MVCVRSEQPINKGVQNPLIEVAVDPASINGLFDERLYGVSRDGGGIDVRPRFGGTPQQLQPIKYNCHATNGDFNYISLCLFTHLYLLLYP